jgi:NADPH:quinone reductase-like Zn-dependent oxidoreductase
MGSERPAVLGRNIAGEIAGKADDVTGFEIGDAVFGLSQGKSYSESVAAKAETMVHKQITLVSRKPQPLLLSA